VDQRTALWTAFDYAVVDFDGNGQKPPDLVEIAVVPIKTVASAARNWLVRSPRPITSMARRIHKITDHQLVDASTVAEIELARTREILIAQQVHPR
jgi:exodeoxyribonuclease X